MSRRLLKSTSLVASMTLLSRLFGFARDVILAGIFGAGGNFDAFVIAFRLPNFMRSLFAEGAFSQAFVPILVDYRENRSEKEVQEFIHNVAGNLSLALILVVILAELLAPLLVTLFAPGFLHDPARFALTQHMLHITFPYLLLIALAAFQGAILNTFGRFALPAFIPVLFNVALIVVSYFWAPYTAQPIVTLSWGVLLGGLLQLLILLPALKRIGITLKFRMNWRDSGVRRVLTLMLPALFGVSVAQLSLLIDNMFASYLPAGSISWLYYSDRLTYLPLGVIGVALATVVLPQLSRYHASQAKRHYGLTLDWALRSALVMGVPASMGLLLLAGPLLVTLIHHGAFNERDVLMTQRSLMAFSLGLPGFMLVKILASGFYSKQNIKTPVKIAAVAVLANLLFNILLIRPLAHAGLALATALSGYVNAGLLWIFLHRHGIFREQRGWILFMARVFFSCAVMVAFLYWSQGALHAWYIWSVWHQAVRLFGLIVIAIAIYLVVLWALGMRFSHFKVPDE